MKKLDSEAPSVFFTTDAKWRAKLRTGGFWLILCPPLGWPMALGYRKAVILTLLNGESPLLPEWRGNKRRFFLDGLRAIGVMFFYFIPFFALLWYFAVSDWHIIARHWREFAAFFLMVAVLVPICLPLLPITYFLCFDWFRLSPTQMVGLGAMFLMTTYVLPAGYMQVSLTGRFRAALDLRQVARLLWYHPGLYAQAWLQSIMLTAAAVACGPLAPWGIFWSYLGIVYTFNEVFTLSPLPEYRARAERGWFARFKLREGISEVVKERRPGWFRIANIRVPVTAIFATEKDR